jgi:hypothetical protein
MARLTYPALLAALVLFLAPVAFAGPPAPEVLWAGAIKTPAGELRIVFHVSQNPEGSLQATFDSPDQRAYGLPVDSFTVADGVLRIEIRIAGGVFEGKLSPDGRKAEGQWSQSGNSLPLALERVDEAPEAKRPQVPAKPYPYHEEQVTYDNIGAGVRLAATLTLPKSGGPFPAVVLIAGSGRLDRDESLRGHKPFLVLADYLTRRGIAVLRADKRGVGGSTGDHGEATTEDYAGDALAGLAYLKTRDEIDAKRIGLLGHSEGADVAPLAATCSGDVAFIVLLAPSGVNGEQGIYEQEALIRKALGAPDNAIARRRAEREQIFAIVNQEKDNAVAEKRIREAIISRFAAMTEEQKTAAGVTKESIEANVQATTDEVLNPWFRFFLSYDPKPTLLKVRVPVLAVWGEKDLQVPPRQNLPLVEEGLEAGGNRDHTIRELPGLNHLLQTAKTGSPEEYAQIAETMSSVALQLIGDWIVAETDEDGGAPH